MKARIRVRLREMQAVLDVTDRDGRRQARLVEVSSTEVTVEIREADAELIRQRLAGAGR